jgi:hypothetical protein
MAKAQNVEVSLDRQSRDSIRSLVAAIDRLAKAINKGESVDNEWISNPGDVAILQRLVEDVRARPNVDHVFVERTEV